jgi:hypothetical protein
MRFNGLPAPHIFQPGLFLNGGQVGFRHLIRRKGTMVGDGAILGGI